MTNGLTYGRHLLRVTLNGKNAGSTSYITRIFGLATFDERTDPREWFIVANDRYGSGIADDFTVPMPYTEATVVRVSK